VPDSPLEPLAHVDDDDDDIDSDHISDDEVLSEAINVMNGENTASKAHASKFKRVRRNNYSEEEEDEEEEEEEEEEETDTREEPSSRPTLTQNKTNNTNHTISTINTSTPVRSKRKQVHEYNHRSPLVLMPAISIMW